MLVEMSTSAATIEKRLEIPQNIKHRICHMIQESYFWLHTEKN